VYITDKHVYKTCGKKTNAYDVVETYKTAERAGVPVPATCKFTADLDDNGTVTSISGVRMTKVSGRFFQFSKAGGEAVLINELNAIDNSLMAQKALDALTNAAHLGVMDPQGFVCSTSNPPICFIDLHYRNSPNPIAFDVAITAARTNLERLTSRVA